MKRETMPAVLIAKAQTATKVSPAIAPQTVAPPIQISIGRVEVRAGAAASAPISRTAKAEGPRLKLEDYLNERSRSGR
jgi:hypothetical protein